MSRFNEENKAAITVIRTNDSFRQQVEIPLSSSLNKLKDCISSSEFGPVNRHHQRLFHLGRELKSGRKSLLSLGVGKFDNFLLHLHSTAPKTIDLSLHDDGGDKVRNNRHKMTRKRNTGVIDLVDDEDSCNDDNDDVEVVDQNKNISSQSQKRRRR